MVVKNVIGAHYRTLVHRTILSVHQVPKSRNYVSTAEFQPNNTIEQSFQDYYTHNPIEGYIRNSPFDVVTTPNLSLDQYAWQNLAKWPNHIATVSTVFSLSF